MITNETTPQILRQELQIAEKLFGAQTDPNQLPATMESANKLRKLSKDCVLTELNEDSQPISWVVVIPTTKNIMQRFLDKTIGERELTDSTKPSENYDALYLCSAITSPQHKNKGYATALFKEAVSRIPLSKDYELFAWPTTKEGSKFTRGLEKKLGRKILIRI